MKQNDLPKNRPTVNDVLSLVHDLYYKRTPCTTGRGAVGGHLHIVLDDNNTEAAYVQYCYENALKDMCTACSTIALLLLQMSQTQRKKIVRMISI